MARRDQTLYRDMTDAKIAGVCSGIGRYFDVDTTLVRVAFVALALSGGGGILAYAVLWYVLDEAPNGAPALSTEPEIVIDTLAVPPHIDGTPTSFEQVLHEGSHPEPHSSDLAD